MNASLRRNFSDIGGDGFTSLIALSCCFLRFSESWMTEFDCQYSSPEVGVTGGQHVPRSGPMKRSQLLYIAKHTRQVCHIRLCNQLLTYSETAVATL